MMESNDKKLTTDEEWATMVQSRFEAQSGAVDEVAKARVWKRLERQTAKPRRRPLAPWAALAAALLAVVGVTQFLKQPTAWREKGRLDSIPINLTPYRLAADGATTPLDGAPAVGDTIVFRAHAAQRGVYAVVIRENDQAPRIAIQENQEITSDDILITKSGSIYGIQIEPMVETTVCVFAMPDREALANYLQTLPSVLPTTVSSGCVVLEAPSP